MKYYNIIGGVNGVGKSSLAGVLYSRIDDMGEIIDPDDIARKQNCGNIEAGRIAKLLINEYIDDGISFTQETTLSSVSILKTIRLAKENNYRIRLFYVGVGSMEESLLRIENRVRKGGHNIPVHDVERRYSKRFDDVKKVLKYCNEAYFYDNENGFVEVGDYRHGKFYVDELYLPDWYVELIEHCR
ncbi:MAG: zeta toxin family protein [Lachnospiraceae bacterium]|nr:zeta toxin family protein [Lachnospiraceae bacterium]MCM1232848.1 zeta toxin family protein [Ruminococcus flavefaciens]